MSVRSTEQAAAMAGVAKVTNVGVALQAMRQVQAAPSQMPHIAVLSGAPGLGKTQAAAYMAHPMGVNAVFVQLRPFETMKSLAKLLLAELDVRVKSHESVPEMFEQICERLSVMQRPLLIDEVDHIAETKSVDFIRAIHDKCATPIFLIGEEKLQQKLLSRHERFHDRVLVWAHAVPCDVDDTASLAKHYVPALAWEPNALQALVSKTQGVARRITTELERIKEECKHAGTTSVTPAMVGTSVRGARR
jgi:DNA transposition AAA+ family ATPase